MMIVNKMQFNEIYLTLMLIKYYILLMYSGEFLVSNSLLGIGIDGALPVSLSCGGSLKLNAVLGCRVGFVELHSIVSDQHQIREPI